MPTQKFARKVKTKKHVPPAAIIAEEKQPEPSGLNLQLVLGLIAAGFAFLLYISTVSYEYVLDDASVIKSNYIVQQGLHGIATILETPYWYGFRTGAGDLYR